MDRRKLPPSQISPSTIPEIQHALGGKTGIQYGVASLPRYVLKEVSDVLMALYDERGIRFDDKRSETIRVKRVHTDDEYIQSHVPGSGGCDWPGYHWDSEHGTAYNGTISSAVEVIERMFRQEGHPIPR